ncbi:flagellar hook-length control protein FliK [Sphingobium sp. BHU LFT2]|uniref:flagellar hook-length control protein FliK n=1 Tax=Sphingobium sp. BHU LFT2 TaxID=2807634 RepID=UPI001BE912FE|nr:flagellar hook-length control protein FliK [Sphingobium sp. BHU LFT2]MBT2242211.1 flagellar hook-length control protein FliK [Sphingobium sp. BHU LFT2]
MTMLASLKSLLFSSTPLAGATTAAASAVVEGATDFAALLSDVDGAPQPAAPATTVGAPALPAEATIEGDAPVVMPEAIEAPALPDTAEFLTQRAMPVQPVAEPAPPVVAAALPVAEPVLPVAASVQNQADVAPVSAEPAPIVLPEGEADAEALPLPLPTPAPVVAPAPADIRTPAPVPTADMAAPLPVEAEGPIALALADAPIKAAPTHAPQPLPAAMAAPEADDIADGDSEADMVTADAPVDSDAPVVADPIAHSLPAALPPLPQAPIDAPASSAPSAPTREMPLSVSPSLSPSLSQTQAPSKPAVGQEAMTAPVVGADGQDDPIVAAPVAAPAMTPELVAAMIPAQPVPVANATPNVVQAPVQAAPQPAIAPRPVEQVVPAVAAAPEVNPDMPAEMLVAAAKPTEKTAPAAVTSSPDEGDVEIASAGTDIPAAPVAAKPAKAEALSLLQLVRDHMNRRATPVCDSAEAAAPISDRTPDKATTAVDPLVATTPAAPHRSAEVSVPQAAAPQTPSVTPAAMPTVDLSASLGQQVVDMGVSGQWIDGLARDIAGLSANGAQGRFQINADQLGPIQVDIRQDGDGAAVSLTVASEAAEMALRQDSDRLKLDAGLAAVRIHEVKIERAPHVAEAAKADANGQTGSQSNGQQGNASQQQGAWQGAGQMSGQSMGQSSSQGRWQGRENNGLGHKAGSDPAVLNHGDTGDSAGDVRRARYA